MSTQPVEIRTFDSERDAYRRLWSASNPNSFFRSIAHLAFIRDITDCEIRLAVIRNDEGGLACALPFAVKHGPYGTILNSLPYFGSYGNVVGSRSEYVSSALVNGLFDFAKSIGCATLTLVNDWRDPAFYGDADPSLLVTRRTNQVTWLDQSSPDKLKDSYHYKTRNMVRKAEKEGITVHIGTDAADINGLRRIHHANMEALGGIGKPEAFFQLLESPVCDLGRARIYVAEHEGQAIAYLLNFYVGDTVEYYMPAVSAAHRNLQPLSLIVARAMHDAATDGYRAWNWGGTWPSQESLRRFKMRWGTTEYEYQYFTWVFNREILRNNVADLSAGYKFFFVAPYEALMP